MPSHDRIRPADERDAEALARVGALVFAATYGAAVPPDRLRAYLAEQFTPAAFLGSLAGGPPLIVAEHDGEVVGYARLAAGAPPPCAADYPLELAQLYVDPRHHGRGLGGMLLEGVDRAAPGPLWLCAWERNARALRFYARHGFAEVGRMDVFVYETVFHDRVLARGRAPNNEAYDD